MERVQKRRPLGMVGGSLKSNKDLGRCYMNYSIIITTNNLSQKNKNALFDFFKSKKVKISKEEASEFYKVHQTKPFYNDLCTYLSSGPIVVMILEHENAVLRNRDLMGATNPKDAEEGTIRKKYGISIDKNSVHGSDSVENAKIEIDFFFKD